MVPVLDPLNLKGREASLGKSRNSSAKSKQPAISRLLFTLNHSQSKPKSRKKTTKSLVRKQKKRLSSRDTLYRSIPKRPYDWPALISGVLQS
jgi:hypothetical protein